MATKGLSVGLLMVLQFLSGCTSEEKEHADAIAEVEKHCGLPSGSLAKTYVDRKGNVPKSDTQKPDDRVIRFGPLINPYLLQRQECINSFKSSNGLKFEIKQVSPYVIHRP